MTDITLTMDGSEHHLAVELRATALDLLREQLGLTGSKKAATKTQVAHAPLCPMANDNLSEYLIPVNAHIDAVDVIMLPERDEAIKPIA